MGCQPIAACGHRPPGALQRYWIAVLDGVVMPPEGGDACLRRCLAWRTQRPATLADPPGRRRQLANLPRGGGQSHRIRGRILAVLDNSQPSAMSPLPIGSVLIPAHNEAAVIGRCLDHLFEGIDVGELEVTVVCNGCNDDTASVARASGHPVVVIELEEASKPAALRAGDRLLRAFPRLYLDADVVLQGQIARQVLEHLAHDGAIAARPPFRYDTGHSSAIVRRYFRARSRIPAVMGSMWGAGVYGLSAGGRARFGDHPDVVAEDLFVHQHFDLDEIDIVGDDPVVVVAPARYRDLLKVRRRAYRGVVENRAAGNELGRPDQGTGRPRSTTPSTLHDMLRLCRNPPGALDAATYAFVAISARLYNALGRSARWERDESSRSIAGAR